MKQGKTRQELELALIEPMVRVKRSLKISDNIKKFLFREHQILEGNTQSWINDPQKELKNLEWRVLYLVARQVFLQTKVKDADPNLFFTEIEVKRAKQYVGTLSVEDDLKFPLVLKSVNELSYGVYSTTIDVKVLAQLSSQHLNYNFNIQRESKKVIKGGETIEEATLVMSNVLEIRDHLKEGTLIHTTIVINAGLGTSPNEELFYDPLSKELVINEGTVLDIVDGYHRCRGSELAINEKPNIDFSFNLILLNYTDEMAAKYQGQMAMQTQISRPKQLQLSATRNSDEIAKKLMTQSELKDRVAIAHVPSVKNKELVAYTLLTQTIEEEFKLERNIDVHKVGEYLTIYFDLLLGFYEDEFLVNPLEWKRKSMINENNMFIGYIVLANRMYEANIEPSKVIDYIDKIDFNKDNILWKKIGVLNESGNLSDTRITRKSIGKYFREIEL